jgi:hypothetical protein
MANLGAVGTNTRAVPSVMRTMGPPWWYSPFNTAIATRNESDVGAAPFPGGRFSGATPVDQITIIVANYGQAGGGISIF